jgi:hypothetical protein
LFCFVVGREAHCVVGGGRTVPWRTAVGWLLIGVGIVAFAAVGYLLIATDRDPGIWRLLAVPLVFLGRWVKDGFGGRGRDPGKVTAAAVVGRLPGTSRWRVQLDDGAEREVTVPFLWRWRGGPTLGPGVHVAVRSWDDPPSARLLPQTPEPVAVRRR